MFHDLQKAPLRPLADSAVVFSNFWKYLRTQISSLRTVLLNKLVAPCGHRACRKALGIRRYFGFESSLRAPKNQAPLTAWKHRFTIGLLREAWLIPSACIPGRT